MADAKTKPVSVKTDNEKAERKPKPLYAVIKGAPRDVLAGISVELTRDVGAVLDIVNDPTVEARALKVAPVK